MHRKSVLYIQEGMKSYARYSKAVSELDADFTACHPADLGRYLADADLVICGVDAARAGNLSEFEQVLRNAGEASLLLVVEEDALKGLRLPSHVTVDFVLATASEDELLVRMRHLLWPGEETANSDFVTIDSMTINFSTYQVIVDGKPVDFTYLEYALLAFLVTHPGHAYSRDALLSRVWGFDYYGGSRTVDVHVRRVRGKLGSELSTHLRTVRGVGYMWE